MNRRVNIFPLGCDSPASDWTASPGQAAYLNNEIIRRNFTIITVLRTQRSWPAMLRLVLTETPSTLNPGQDFSADVQHCSTAEWLKKKKKKLTGWFSCVQKSYNEPQKTEDLLFPSNQSQRFHLTDSLCCLWSTQQFTLRFTCVLFVAVRRRCRTRWGSANVLRGSWQEGDWSKVPYCQVRQSQEGSGVVLELFDLSVA